MNSAIASLESRLAKGGGTDGDWELLAKSFEFLGRPADAAQARAHKLPPVPADSDASGPTVPAPLASGPMASTAPMASAAPAASGTAVSGEIMLAPALKAKAAAGETLFIVAKSVDAPGVPVAVLRSSVGSWPLKFTLDDSQSMLPGRNLSSAGRVTIEARISQKGQPLPASGDLQGTTGVINPADHQPLKILIDRVIT
ncbi:MAG: c-type cytochrome biogenesis protein CcmI/CycH [Steroidobacteraceae bacterium]